MESRDDRPQEMIQRGHHLSEFPGSRAQPLAIVVASPALLAPRCRTFEEMGLVNLLGKLRYHSVACPPPGRARPVASPG